MVDYIEFLVILFVIAQHCGVYSFELCSGVGWRDLLCFVYTCYNSVWVQCYLSSPIMFFIHLQKQQWWQQLELPLPLFICRNINVGITWTTITIARSYNRRSCSVEGCVVQGRRNRKKEKKKEKKERKEKDKKKDKKEKKKEGGSLVAWVIVTCSQRMAS